MYFASRRQFTGSSIAKSTREMQNQMTSTGEQKLVNGWVVVEFHVLRL